MTKFKIDLAVTMLDVFAFFFVTTDLYRRQVKIAEEIKAAATEELKNNFLYNFFKSLMVKLDNTGIYTWWIRQHEEASVKHLLIVYGTLFFILARVISLVGSYEEPTQKQAETLHQLLDELLDERTDVRIDEMQSMQEAFDDLSREVDRITDDLKEINQNVSTATTQMTGTITLMGRHLSEVHSTVVAIKAQLQSLSEIMHRFALNREDWRAIQTALVSQGHNPGRIDGRVGDRTRRAIRNYQTKIQARVDGNLTPDQIKSLLGYLP